MLAVVLCAMHAGGDDAQTAANCKNRKDLVGACIKVRGRLRAYGSNPRCRIWPVGTTHLLGVADAGSLPSNVACGDGFEVYADFTVCPLTPAKPNGLQMVCVASAGNLRASEVKGDGGQ